MHSERFTICVDLQGEADTVAREPAISDQLLINIAAGKLLIYGIRNFARSSLQDLCCFCNVGNDIDAQHQPALHCNAIDGWLLSSASHTDTYG